MYRARATCFYCGKSRLVNSQTPTVRYFKCPNCDAENRFDERGEIEDFAPESPPQRENIRYGFRASPKQQHSAAGGEPVCCNTCLRNQALLVQNLAEYLPDEDHPDYDNYVANLDNYRRQCEQRYPPLCADCAPKVHRKIRQMNYMAKSTSLGKLLENSDQMLKSRALHSRVVWGPVLWAKSLLWMSWGAAYIGSILLLLFWHLCGAMYPMFLESSGELSLEAWKICLRQSKENLTLGSSCYAVSTDWVRNLFPWVLLLLPWNYKWLSVKRNPGSYVINLSDYFKCQGLLAGVLSLDWLMVGKVREEKSLEKFNTIFLVLEILLFWVSMTSLRVSYPTKITFREKPVAIPESSKPEVSQSDLPPSPEPPRARQAAPVSRSFGFVPGRTTNVLTRSQSSAAANGSSSLSFNSSFSQSMNNLAPNPLPLVSTSQQTNSQPETSFWGSQPQPSYPTTAQSSYDADAMEVDNEPPASQMSQLGSFNTSFQDNRFASTTPVGTPTRRPLHHRAYSDSSDEGDDESPVKSRKLLTNSDGVSYTPLAPSKLNANLFADNTGLEGLFEAAARLEDPVPAMSTKAVIKVFANFVVGTIRLVILCIAVTVQLEYIGWPSALATCVAMAVGPFWRICDYYWRFKGLPPMKTLIKKRRGFLFSCLEVLLAAFLMTFNLLMLAWTRLNTHQSPMEMPTPEEQPIFTPIADIFSLATFTNAINPTTIPTSTQSASPPTIATTEFLILAQAVTINVMATKLFSLLLLLHQAFELVLVLVRRNIPSDSEPLEQLDGSMRHGRRSSRDYGVSHAVNQPFGKRSPSPLSSFKMMGRTAPPAHRNDNSDPFGGLSLGGGSSSLVRTQSSPDRPITHGGRRDGGGASAAPLYMKKPVFGMSTKGVTVPPTGIGGFGEGMTLRERGMIANKKKNTAW